MKTLALIFVVTFVASVLGSSHAAFAEELKVGDKAPAFELPGTDGKTYKLSELTKEKVVVIAWYPKALTGG